MRMVSEAARASAPPKALIAISPRSRRVSARVLFTRRAGRVHFFDIAFISFLPFGVAGRAPRFSFRVPR